MAEVTETNIRTDVPAENQSVERCLTFESGDMTLFLSINNVTEIINDCAITPGIHFYKAGHSYFLLPSRQIPACFEAPVLFGTCRCTAHTAGS